MSPVDGIGQVKGIELMVKCELPKMYIAVDSIGGPERGTFVHSDWRPVLAPAAIRVDSILTYHITPTTYESAYQTRRLPVTTLKFVYLPVTIFTPLTTWQTQRHSSRNSKFSAYRRNTIALALSISP